MSINSLSEIGRSVRLLARRDIVSSIHNLQPFLKRSDMKLFPDIAMGTILVFKKVLEELPLEWGNNQIIR